MNRFVLGALLLSSVAPSARSDDVGKEDLIARVKSLTPAKNELVVLVKANGQFKNELILKVSRTTIIQDIRDQQTVTITLEQLRAGDIVVVGTAARRVSYVVRYQRDPTSK